MTPPTPKHSNLRLIVGLAALFALFLASMIVFVMMNKGSVDTSQEDTILKAYSDQYSDLGAGNTIFVALRHIGSSSEREIYDRDFMHALKMVTDDVFFLPGIDRSAVLALHTPYTRHDPNTGEGIPGTAVISASFEPTEEMLGQLKSNVARVGLQGELVATDQRGARVVAKWLPKDPVTGGVLKPRELAAGLTGICLKYDSPNLGVSAVMIVDDKYWVIDRNGVIKKIWINPR